MNSTLLSKEQIEDLKIDVTNLIPEVEKLVNGGVKISRKFGKRILEAYTGVPWSKRNGKYCAKLK